MILLDTNIAIELRDGDGATRRRIAARPDIATLSIITRIELENGVHRGTAEDGRLRRTLLSRLLEAFQIEPPSEIDVLAYGRIVAALGFDRRRTLDRLIAARAITRNAVLITHNAQDFRRIEGLRLETW